jgi:hypothetical protein
VFLAVAALVVSSAPPASAVEPGVDLFLFVGPEGKTVGDDLEVRVLAYDGLDPADADPLSVRLGGSQLAFVDMVHESTGRWTGTYTIAGPDVSLGKVGFTVYATVGGQVYTKTVSYALPSTADLVGPAVTLRLVGGGGATAGLKAGQEVTVEARSYVDGVPTTGGSLEVVARTDPGPGELPITLPTTPQEAPAGRVVRTLILPHVLESSTIVIDGTFTDGSQEATLSRTISVDPMPITAYLFDSSPGHTAVFVQLGETGPIEGAQVTVGGTYTSYAPAGETPIGPVTGQTRQDGSAVLLVDWTTTSAGFAQIDLTASKEGLTDKRTLFPTISPASGAWTPEQPGGGPCYIALQTDPSTAVPGQTFNANFVVTENLQLVPQLEVAITVSDLRGMEVSSRDLYTTNEESKIGIPVTFHRDWTAGEDAVGVRATCPSGATVERQFTLGLAPDFPRSSGQVVTGVPEQTEYRVTTYFSDWRQGEASYGYVAIVPSKNRSEVEQVIAAGAVRRIPLDRGADGYLRAVLDYPGWRNQEDYTLVVVVSNHGSASGLGKEFETVYMEPMVDVPRSPPSPEDVVQEPSPAAGTLAAAVALMATAGATARARLRRRS